jgi:hypothetical protein
VSALQALPNVMRHRSGVVTSLAEINVGVPRIQTYTGYRLSVPN